MCVHVVCVHVVHVYMLLQYMLYMLSTYSFLDTIVGNLPSRIETNLIPARTNEVQIKICEGGREGEGRKREGGKARHDYTLHITTYSST